MQALPYLVRDIEDALVRLGRGSVADQLREANLESWAYDEFADTTILELRSPQEAAAERRDGLALRRARINLARRSRAPLAIEILDGGSRNHWKRREADPRRPMRKRARLFAAVLVILAVALAAWKGDAVVEKALDLRYGQTLPAPGFPAPANEVEARLQDLDYLSRLPQVERSFTAEGRKAFDQHVVALRSRSATLTRAQFFLGVAEAVARAQNAHTGLDRALWRSPSTAPRAICRFPEGLQCARDHSPQVARARILAIDGREPDVSRRCPRFSAARPIRPHHSTFLLELSRSPPALSRRA